MKENHITNSLSNLNHYLFFNNNNNHLILFYLSAQAATTAVVKQNTRSAFVSSTKTKAATTLHPLPHQPNTED